MKFWRNKIMRRTTFYLSVALMAFGVGSFVVFMFHFELNEQPLNVEKIQISENSSEIKTNELFEGDLTNIESFNGYRFVCEDKQLKFFWLNFLREKDVQESLPKKEFDSDVVYNCSEKLQIERIDLNDDGNAEYNVELIDSGICSSKSNCPRMIYERKNGEFKRLLSHKASLLIELENRKTKGYRDLRIVFNTGPYGGYVEEYKFDGKKYKLENCFSRWSDDDGLKRIKCWNSR